MHTKFNEPVELHPIAVQGVYHQIGVDVLGPFPRSASGKVYIATCLDYMTKNAEARALPNKSAEELTDFVYEDVICCHGTPAKCTTDNGGEFDGVFQDLLDRCHVDHRLSSPYHPQANGLTERFNQTLGRALKKMVGQYPEYWDKHIPTILMGYRASIQASTKFSPFFLLHGRDMILPLHNLHRLPAPEADTIEPTAEALLNNVQPLQEAQAVAQENIRMAQSKQKRLYAQRQLHGAHAEDKGKGVMPASIPATAVITPATPVATLPAPSPAILFPPVATTSAAPTAGAPVPATPAAAIAPQAAGPKEVAPRTETTPTTGDKRAAPQPTAVKPGDFVLVKIRARGRPTAKTLGKLAPATEGPYYLAGFTDDTKLVANIEDAEGKRWKRRTEDLCVYMGDA